MAAQVPNQPALAQCDARLAAVLGEKAVKLSSLSARIGPLLTPLPTPKLTYTVRHAPPSCLSKGSPCRSSAYWR
jgi:hypothetical protein